MGSRGTHAESARPIAAMSGLAPVPCCTWTSSAWPALRNPATPSPPTWQNPNRRVGWEYLHVVIDDHSRLAYVEHHSQENAETNAGTLERAIAWFASLGLDPPEAVMTDNAMVYRRSRRFAAALMGCGARHILTPPYTPRWNGKAERFIQTLQREWAYAHRWQSSTERLRSLPSFLRYYNRRRPHSSLGDRPPISRVHNVCG
jgi:transposase InsO family protein